MSFFDVLGLIPKDLQREIADFLVDFVSGQAKKLLGDQVADKLRKLKSDAAFSRAFQDGLQRAADRFVRDYEAEDEDLVVAITADESFFQNEQVQKALLAIIKKPGAHPSDEREMVLQSFETVLPERKNRQRVDRAVTVLLGYLAEEVWTLPELQGVYMLQFQRMTAEAAYLCVFQRDVSGRQDLWCDRWPRMKDTLTDYADIRAVVAAWWPEPGRDPFVHYSGPWITAGE